MKEPSMEGPLASPSHTNFHWHRIDNST